MAFWVSWALWATLLKWVWWHFGCSWALWSLNVSFALVRVCELYEPLCVTFAPVQVCELLMSFVSLICLFYSCAGCVEILPLLEVPTFDSSFGFACDRCWALFCLFLRDHVFLSQLRWVVALIFRDWDFSFREILCLSFHLTFGSLGWACFHSSSFNLVLKVNVCWVLSMHSSRGRLRTNGCHP